MIRPTAILATVFLLSGCAASSYTRSVDDGVYFASPDRTHLSARDRAMLNPISYPFWSIDFFYFSHFFGPMRARAYYDPPLYSSPGPCSGWAKHLCLEELYLNHLLARARAERDGHALTQRGAESTTDPRLHALNSGAELHLAHRISESRRTAATGHQAAFQQQTRHDARAVSARSAGVRDRNSTAQRMRGDRGSSPAGSSGSRMSAARSIHEHGRSSARGSIAPAQSTGISEIEP